MITPNTPKKKPTGRQRRKENAEQVLTKATWDPGTMLYPVPPVMVTCADADGKSNIITVAWAGTVCSEPPMLSISVRPGRYSHPMIVASQQFVVNIPTVRLIRATDYCGVVSGRNENKFETAGLTPGPAKTVNAPIIMECPVNIECAVKQTLELGTHTMFIAEVTAVQVTEQLISEGGRLALETPGLVAYAHGGYYILGKKLGHFGFSVRKKK